MLSVQELREQCAKRLLASVEQACHLTAFVGLDGFVDEIIHLVDVRHDANRFERIPTIAAYAERIAAAAGKSTNIEAVTQRVKLGGNGPIMANALARFGIKVTYLGALGYPTLHPVFSDFAASSDVHTIAPPGLTDAYEFEDGKVMMGKTVQLGEVTWENIQNRFGRKRFADKFFGSHLVGFVNWTMIPFMSDIWEAVQNELCPAHKEARRTMFIDLADPEKRTSDDILRALELIGAFQKHFDVILGLNEKESHEIGKNLGLKAASHTPESLQKLCQEIHLRVRVDTIVVHPTAFALASGPDGTAMVEGPFTPKPKITTGAGDHFNSGFCLGKLLGFPTDLCLLTGVATSGFYVRTAQSPNIKDLAEMLRHWPV